MRLRATSPETAVPLSESAPSTPGLDVQDLSIQYRSPGGTVHAVNEVTLAVPSGSILAVVGETGSGKSTLARGILGLLPRTAQVTSGRILAGDGDQQLDLTAMGERERRSLSGTFIGFVPQGTRGALNPVETVGHQFHKTIRAHQGRREARGWREAAERGLAEVGFLDPDRVLRLYPHQMSGGMAQRAVLALALCLGPRLLVADEPTSGLDAAVRAAVLQTLVDTVQRRDRTLVMVTHDIELVRRHCGMVAVMYGGFLVEAGPTASVLSNPKHPYTRALVGAVPRRGHPLAVLAGAVGDLTTLPEGCAFASRCPGPKDSRCLSERPPLRAVGPAGHVAATFCEG